MSGRNGFIILLFIRLKGRSNCRIYLTKGEIRLGGAFMGTLLLSGLVMDIFHGKSFQRSVSYQRSVCLNKNI